MVKSKKGVESIIAVVLILMITIASAASFFFWYTRVQQSAEGKTEQSTTFFLNQLISCVKVPYANYNLMNNESEIHVQNCGTTSVGIGDGDDNVLVTSEPCAFNIDSINCDVCPLTLGPGALGKFALRFNNVTCSGTNTKAADIMADQGNLQHRITFSIDGTTTTASKDFIPAIIYSCSVSLSEQVDIMGIFPPPPTIACINYTINSGSNVAQTFGLSAETPPPPAANCSIIAIYDSVDCTGSVITQKAVPARGTGIFSVGVFVNSTPPFCIAVTHVTSTDMSTCTDWGAVLLVP